MKPKKEVFRKTVVDLVMILPVKEGTITGGGLVTMRVPYDSITNVEFMSATFRQMWVSLVKEDKQLNREFEDYFKNQALEQKRLEKKLQKLAMKVDQKKVDKIEAKLKEYEKTKGKPKDEVELAEQLNDAMAESLIEDKQNVEAKA